MKLRDFFAAGLICALLASPVSALTLEVNGTDCTEQTRAVLMEGRTYVSLRAVSAILEPGAQVSWSDGSAFVTGAGYLLSACPGEQHIRYNDRYIYAGGEIRNVDGTVMLPLRALCSALGGVVSWEEETATASLRTDAAEAEPEPAAVYDEQDLYWLSRIISAESRGEPLKGKIAVGTVVLNRVASGEFPNTIYDVIFDGRWGGQFEPVRNGTVYDEPTEESVLAAKLCLQGAREAGKSLYFLAPALTNNHWTMHNRAYVTTIGCHWFYE